MYHKFFIKNKEVAMHIKHLIDNKKQIDRTIYFHKDILNSTIAMTDNASRLLSRSFYTPFGEEINIDELKDEEQKINKEMFPGFTGHKRVRDNVELIFMKARMYDSKIARFISPDSIVPNPKESLSYNRYVYVYNNPLKYIDPNGHFAWFIFGAIFYTIGSTSDNAEVSVIGRVVGNLMMGIDLKDAGFSAFKSGAIRGFYHKCIKWRECRADIYQYSSRRIANRYCRWITRSFWNTWMGYKN